MKTKSQHESLLWQVLAKQRLADFSQFYTAGFFDEVPFYSRYADVEFLKRWGIAKANVILLQFSLKYLNALAAYDAPQLPFLAAITVRQCNKRELLVPHVFVCHGDCEERLRGHLVLHATTSSFGTALGRLVNAARPGAYQVLEEDLTVPGHARVFIGHRATAHNESVAIDSFLAGAELSPTTQIQDSERFSRRERPDEGLLEQLRQIATGSVGPEHATPEMWERATEILRATQGRIQHTHNAMEKLAELRASIRPGEVRATFIAERLSSLSEGTNQDPVMDHVARAIIQAMAEDVSQSREGA